MIKNKRGFSNEALWSVYRTILVAFIAFIILGLGFFVYDYYLDVRDVEAGILVRQVADCVAPQGFVDLKVFDGYEKSVLDYCGFNNDERVYVNVDVCRLTNGALPCVSIGALEQGDSGALWVKDIYSEESVVENIKKYAPGHLEKNYVVGVFDENNQKVDGRIKIEVLVGHEF